MPYAVELRDVSYRYPNAKNWSLRHINLTVEKGKFVAIMGANGAGKTTLALCLNGLVPQLTEGELNGQVLTAGLDTAKFRVQTVARQIGLVLQDPEAQIFGRTVWEDVSFGPRNYLSPLPEIERRGNAALDLVKLTGFNQRNTAELSGGEKQRLALAGILALAPEIIVLDEPAAELDPLGRRELYAALDRLRREKGHTVIVVEHSPEEVLARADEVVVLQGGEIVWQGAPGQLFGDSGLVTRWGLRPLSSGPFAVPPDENSKGNAQENLIEIKGLEYAYDVSRQALRGIDLTIEQGEFVALVGPNGAGKTTLTKHLNGLLKPSRGDVRVAGRNTRHYPVAEFARLVGYLFQNPDHQIFAASVEKEIAYGLKNAGMAEAESKERIEEALRFTGLGEERQAHPFSLSRGERQLLAVASILALQPQVLVIDEPTAGLDWAGTQRLMKIIRSLHRQGTTVVMISHDLELAAAYAERIIVLREGRVWRDGPVDLLFRDPGFLADAASWPAEGQETAEEKFGGVYAEPTESQSDTNTGKPAQEAVKENLGANRANSGESGANLRDDKGNLRDNKGNSKADPKDTRANPGENKLISSPDGVTGGQRLDVRTKAAVFLTMVLLACLFRNPLINLALAGAFAWAAWREHVRLRRVLAVLGPLLPVFLLILIVNALSLAPGLPGDTGRILFYILPGSRLGVSGGGLIRGFSFILRILLMVLATAFFTAATTTDEIVQLLHGLRLPPAAVFVVTTALRFVPSFDRRRIQILEAQKARGARLEEKGFIAPVRAYIPVMVPLLIYAIVLSNSLAMAMLNRGFGFSKQVTAAKKGAFTRRDYLIFGITALSLAAGLYLRRIYG